MHIRKYPYGYSRRYFLKQMGSGVLATGVLAPLWNTVAAKGDITSAYPDELLSIEDYTRGDISTGAIISANNVEKVNFLNCLNKYVQ